MEKRSWTLSSTATSLKLGQCNPLPSILCYSLIVHNAIIDSVIIFFATGSPHKHWNVLGVLPIPKMASKTVTRSTIQYYLSQIKNTYI